MTRLTRAWGELEPEQRLAGIAAVALILTLLLPWYSKTVTVVVGNAARADQTSLSGISAMSFVEAAVLLVSAGVLALLFARAERRDFHMPGSDGAVITGAGVWAAALIFYRLVDKPGLTGTQKITATVGVEWGIFFALAAACAMAYAGWRMRAAAAPEPPVLRARSRIRGDTPPSNTPPSPTTPPSPGSEDLTVVAPSQPRSVRAAPAPVRARGEQPPAAAQGASRNEPPRPLAPPSAPATQAARKRPRYPPTPSEQQLSFDDSPVERD
ncbi:MAG TPA: hypothetical protein VHS55_04675 [Solirubrobacteraceae bacterium]|jgi:hypothetical protein|nr:hypothetical protein [Solirubrobacteraceae bacterium]